MMVECIVRLRNPVDIEQPQPRRPGVDEIRGDVLAPQGHRTQRGQPNSNKLTTIIIVNDLIEFRNSTTYTIIYYCYYYYYYY